MNWKSIAKLAASLFVAEFAIGFLDGASSINPSITWFASSALVSFVAYGLVFFFFARRQSIKPFTNAWAALSIQIVVDLALALAQALSRWLVNTPWPLIALEWFVLICALIVGTSVGSIMGRSAGRSADA